MARRPSPSEYPPASSARDRVAVVANGNAKRVTEDLVEVLDQILLSGDLFVSRSLEEGKEIAETIVERGYPTVLTAGGDGTFVQMVTWVTKAAEKKGCPRPRFGLLRLGTGNALAWVLGAESPRGRGVIADLARLRTTAGTGKLRLLDVEGILTPFAGLGVDAVTLALYNDTKDKLRRIPVLERFAAGGLAYFVAIVGRAMPEYLVRGHPRVRIVNEGAPAVRLGVDGQPVGGEVKAGDVLYEGPSRMVAMSSIPYWGFGARIFPFAQEREDRFSLRVVDLTSLDVALYIRSIWKGTFRSDKVHDFLVEEVSIHYDEPQDLQIGGDPAGKRKVVHARLAPEPIDVVDYYAPPGGP
jgi:diacylglycerol kinase family enzyme